VNGTNGSVFCEDSFAEWGFRPWEIVQPYKADRVFDITCAIKPLGLAQAKLVTRIQHDVPQRSKLFLFC